MSKCNRCYHRVATPGWICIMYDCDIFGDKGWKKYDCKCFLEDIDQSKKLDRDMINQMILEQMYKNDSEPYIVYLQVQLFRQRYNEDYLTEKAPCIQFMKHHFFRRKYMKEY